MYLCNLLFTIIIIIQHSCIFLNYAFFFFFFKEGIYPVHIQIYLYQIYYLYNQIQNKLSSLVLEHDVPTTLGLVLRRLEYQERDVAPW